MAGRAQAANLTGMLSQIAETVGEMGKASDWTHQNVRDYSAPKLDTNDPASLQAYADYSQRNGNPQDAAKYAQMATDLGVKQEGNKAKTTLANLQASASNMNRLLSDPKLSAQNKATIQQNLDVVLTQMNTVGANSVQHGGTGLEGEAHRKAMKKESDDATLVRLQIDERRSEVGAAVAKGDALHRGLFPDTPAGNDMWDRYSGQLTTLGDDATPEKIATLNGTYSTFLNTAITDAVAADSLTHKAQYAQAESQYSSDMQAHYTAYNSATTKEEKDEITAAMAATTAEAEKIFSRPEYATMNNLSMDARAASAGASVQAIADKGIAREKLKSELRSSLLGEELSKQGLSKGEIDIEIARKTAKLKALQIPAAELALKKGEADLTLAEMQIIQETAEYADFVATGDKMTRDEFLTDRDFEAYSKGYDNALPEAKRTYNSKPAVKAMINRKVASIEASKIMPGMNREVMSALQRVADKHPTIAAAINDAIGGDGELANFAGQNILETMASIVEDGNLIATFEGLPEPEREAMIDQAVQDYLVQYQPGLVAAMRDDVKDNRYGWFFGTETRADRATRTDERGDRMIGDDLAMGTGTYYLEALAKAEEMEGFNKLDFDRQYYEKNIKPIFHYEGAEAIGNSQGRGM